jgi:D-tyrosyl-tRNA(Tyr) deacylase
MIALIQRVRHTALKIEGKLYSNIGPGMLVLLGISTSDSEKEAEWLASKIASLRIFSDENGKMNLDVKVCGGDIMVVSQFTLLADASHGNRPSYINAARPETAIPLYEHFIFCMEKSLGKPVKTGVFGADMQIDLCNDGPVTISLDTEFLMKKR